jgi:DNA-binding MarR family transcriptional regulator
MRLQMAAVFYPSGQLQADWGSAPLLAIGNSPAARAAAVGTAEAAGIRIADVVSVADADARLDAQVSNGGVWLELYEVEPAPQLEALMSRLDRESSTGLYPVVAAVPKAMIDLAFGHLPSSTVQILVDPDAVERAVALAVAGSGLARTRSLSDVATDNSATRLRQLSDEVSRIAATLARLSSGPGSPPPVITPSPTATDAPSVAPETLRAIIRARRLRATHLPPDLFADPAWDMLLDLLQAEIAQHRVPVSSLCIAAAVPATTALRWIKTMTDRGLLLRREDPHDGRRVFIEMSPATSTALRRFFVEAGKVAVI